MASNREWADAFLAQGNEDLAAATRLDASTPGTTAMLLQMVFEKLAKAALLKRGTPLEELRHHHVASRLIQTLVLNPLLLEALGGGNVNAWDDVLQTIKDLEDAHPSDPRDPKGKRVRRPEGKPQLEFPWEDAAPPNAIRWPSRDLPVAQLLADPASGKLERLFKFAAALSGQHGTLFP